MPTSSITDNIRINNPKVLTEYITAMEEAASKPLQKHDYQDSKLVTDPQKIKMFMEKAIQKKRSGGIYQGKIQISDDFDDPLDDFQEYQ